MWSVISVTCDHSRLDTPKEFGTNWYVTFTIKYTTALIGGFSEPPNMEWNEVIMNVDFEKKEYWDLSGDFYTQKPESPTMAVWAQRYFRASLHAHNLPFRNSFGTQKGHSKLFDKKGAPVTAKMLGTHVGEPAQNKAVQDYLKKHDGILEIQVHDIPNILKAGPGKQKNLERVLIFDCGVTGIGPRVKAFQHIKMDSTKPPQTWTYTFQTTGLAPGVKTSGMKKVADPTPKGDLLPTGGIW